MTVTAGGKSKSISVTADCVEVAQGTPVSVNWPLTTNDDFILDGPATVIPQSWSEMYVQRYAAPNANTIWPSESGYETSEKTQRNLIEGDAWPANEIDEVSTRYIEFGVKANDGTILNIDSIGFYVCGSGGSGMRCNIYYQIDNETPIAMNAADGTILRSTMASNTMYEVSARPVISLKPDQIGRAHV